MLKMLKILKMEMMSINHPIIYHLGSQNSSISIFILGYQYTGIIYQRKLSICFQSSRTQETPKEESNHQTMNPNYGIFTVIWSTLVQQSGFRTFSIIQIEPKKIVIGDLLSQLKQRPFSVFISSQSSGFIADFNDQTQASHDLILFNNSDIYL